MPNQTKRIAVRPNEGSALQKAVNEARANGIPVSDLIHDMATICERKAKRKDRS